MCDHGRGLDGRVTRSRRMAGTGSKRLAAGQNRRLARRRRGRGLRGAWVQARMGRQKGREGGQADGPNRAKIACSAILPGVITRCLILTSMCSDSQIHAPVKKV